MRTAAPPPRAAPARAASRGRARLLAALPVAVALAAGANTLPGDFVFDDVLLLERGKELQDFEPRRIFASGYWGADRADRNYRPVTLLTYALNFRLGEGAWSFHLVNVLLAAGLALAAYALLLHLADDPVLAALGASLWAALPIRVEAIANIVGRAELLAALSALAVWLIAWRRPRSPGWAIAAGAILFCGLASKESAVVALIILPGASWLLGRPQPWRHHAALAVALLLYLGLRAWVLAGKENVITFVDNPLAFTDAPTRIVNAVSLLGLYLEKTALPYVRTGLSADYSYDQLPVRPLGDPTLWLRAILVAGILGGALLLRRRAPLVALGAFVFLAASSLTANIAFPIGTIFGERLAFLPSLGLPIAVVGALAMAPRPARLRIGAPLLVVLIALYGTGTWHRSAAWENSWTMGLHMAEDAPRSTRSQLKAAEARVELWRDGERSPGDPLLQEALRDIERSLAIHPKHGRAIAKRGEILLEQRRFPEAVAALTEAEQAMREARPPESEPLILRFRALASLQLERWADVERDSLAYLAIPRLTRAPESAIVWNALGLARANAQRLPEALECFDTAVALHGGIPEVRSNRGYCRFLLGDIDGARQDYEAGLELCRREGKHFAAAPEGESAWRFLLRLADLEAAAARALRQAGREAEAQAAEAMAARRKEEAASLHPPRAR